MFSKTCLTFSKTLNSDVGVTQVSCTAADYTVSVTGGLIKTALLRVRSAVFHPQRGKALLTPTRPTYTALTHTLVHRWRGEYSHV